jgi:hypothetical protein
MSVKAILQGQVWRNDSDGLNYLVTKVYTEVFTHWAVLRQATADAADEDTVRVKIVKAGNSASLPGYTFTQESQDF